MIVLRPALTSDLCDLERLANASGPLVSTLPESRTHLENKVALSQDSFSKETKEPDGESYLFVLEDSSTGTIIGTGGINALAGHNAPFYSYRCDTKIHASRELNVHNRVQALTLNHDLSDHSQLCSFYIVPELADSLCPALITLGRLLFMTVSPKRFANEWMAVLPGIFDKHGRAPFWEHVGRKFCDIDYTQVEYYNSTREKTFIVEMMPYHPLYISLMDEEAQAVIGCVHDHAELQRSLLNEQGFSPDKHVEIFDAGVIYTANKEVISLRNQTQLATLAVNALHEATQNYLVGINDELGFQACFVEGVLVNDQLCIDANDFAHLDVPSDKTVFVVALNNQARR